MRFASRLLCCFLLVSSGSAILFDALAAQLNNLLRRGGLTVVVSSRRGLDGDYLDGIVRKGRKIDGVEWPEMLQSLERQPNRYNFRGRRCFLVNGLPKTPEIAVRLVNEIRRTTTHTILSLNIPDSLN